MDVAERFHYEIEMIGLALEGYLSFGAGPQSATQDFSLDGSQASAFFATDDFRVGKAQIVLFSPGQRGRIDPCVAQFPVLVEYRKGRVLEGYTETLFTLSQGLFGPLLPGDVAGNHRGTDHRAYSIFDRRNCYRDLDGMAVLVQPGRFGNTIQIQKIVEELRASGHPVKDEDLARVSPLIRAHVIPNGSYDLSLR